MFDYEEGPRITFDCGEGGVAQFVRVCPNCGRFVKADDEIWTNESTGLKKQPNATCSKCGRVEMPFEGFF